MTITEAANNLRVAVINADRQQVLVNALSEALRIHDAALKAAQEKERNAERELVRLSGGRYWDHDTATMKVDHA